MSACIESTYFKRPDGYCHRQFRDKIWLAHRVAWVEENGEIPDGLHVLHKCDNPPCINTEHLFLGTHKDNMHDMIAKGRKSKNTGRAKLNWASVGEIRAIQGQTDAAIAKNYGVGRSTIQKIRSMTTWNDRI